MDMVERVARIFAGSYAAAILVPGKNLFIEDYWPNFKGEARAAIDAMREPTDEMMGVTGKSTTIHGTEFTFCVGDLVKNGMWQAVIDAAINGNVISLDPVDRLMKTEGMTFPEAIKHLADKKGLS